MLNELCGLAGERIDELISRLEIDVRFFASKYVGSCPVHGGDGVSSFHLHPDGDSVKGTWGCYSRGCHKHFVRSLLGLTRGVLSHRRYDWRKPGHKVVRHEEAVDYLLDFVGVRLSDVRYDASLVSNHRFMKEVEYLMANPPRGRGICDRGRFRRRVEMPCRYFLDRGFSESVLDTYDVGMCVNEGSRLFGRAVVPVYDDDGEMVVGCIGRSVHAKCEGCGLYHDPPSPCPTGRDRLGAFKWICSEKFNDKFYLYNFWRAKVHADVSRCVVIVEGAPDVWRLEEAGVHNAVALLGIELSDVQMGVLERLSVSSIVVATDMDEGGRKGARGIIDDCKYLANTHILELPPGKKDIGDMSVEEVRRHVLPFVESKSRRR